MQSILSASARPHVSAYALHLTASIQSGSVKRVGRSAVALLIAVLISGLGLDPTAHAETPEAAGSEQGTLAGTEPIVLTTDDLDRVVRERAVEAERMRLRSGIVSNAGHGKDEDESTPAEQSGQAEKRGSSDDPELVGFSGPVRSWRDEYYRLKALALRRAIASGELIDFGDAGPGSSTDVSSNGPHGRGALNIPATRSCIYGAKGKLLHAPKGADCRSETEPTAIRGSAQR